LDDRVCQRARLAIRGADRHRSPGIGRERSGGPGVQPQAVRRFAFRLSLNVERFPFGGSVRLQPDPHSVRLKADTTQFWKNSSPYSNVLTMNLARASTVSRGTTTTV